jgi:hypothetical protein
VLSEFKRKTNIGVGFGWLLLILGRLLAHGAQAPRQAVGYIVMLLGALNVIGLLILYFLPDRNKEAAKI